jgi:hypothetical protein
VALSPRLWEKGTPLRDVHCYHFHDKVHRLWHVKRLLTLGHCKAKPLQVRVEEGPRSKYVRVSGLQYCLYS